MIEQGNGYCIVVSEDEIDEALTEIYIKQGRYDVINGEIYDKVTGKYIGKLEKPISRD